MSRRLLLGLALAGIVCGVVIAAITLASDHTRRPRLGDRAVAEALTNVAKYAAASAATIAVSVDDSRVGVEVADDGVGGADVTEGSGLRGLSDRVAALDGTLALDSPPGAGTRLRAEIPL
jgi:glucose-6-phosphate-specific signal transduction histidine kinase